ncbi:MAG: GTP cyclohydrolase I FolE [Lachnospiraceae bacterium]|nr:GTP cyclohydrolase I FolE [Lachnospiraceae bacterium]
MAIDQEKIKKSIREIIEALGDDPDREGLADTPERVARMCVEVFDGMNYTNHEIAEMFSKTFDEEDNDGVSHKDIVIVRDIDIFSYCEHHMALMYDMKATVAYIPNGKVIGLSKIARICDKLSKRLQIQERLTRDIAETVSEVTGSSSVAVIIKGKHSCMTARGIKKPDSCTVTSVMKGAFETDPSVQSRFDALLRA